MPFELYRHQIDMVRSFELSDKLVINCSRQLGTTALLQAYALKFAIENAGSNIYITSNKHAAISSYIYDFVKEIATSTVVNNKFKIQLTNGSYIFLSGSSSAYIRGLGAPDLWILDNAAYYSHNDADAYYATLARTNKIIMASVPNKKAGLFYNIWAHDHTWTKDSYPWYRFDGRNLKWKADRIAEIGFDAFQLNYCCSFDD